MSLQSHILSQYRHQFPRHTLREIAHVTGIQLTRVFRILNGAPMKLEEYERFHLALGSDEFIPTEQTAFQHAATKATKILAQAELAKLALMLERHLTWHELIHGMPQDISHEQVIA
jgi:hypothetical protein